VRRRRRANRVQSAAILLTLVGFAALTGLLIGGSDGLIFAAGLAALFLIISATAGDELFRQAYGAVQATPAIAPDLVRVLTELGRRAGLPCTPTLYIVPSGILQALAAGNRNAPAIAVTSGLLHALPAREVAAVLAHEVAHIRHGDAFLMRLAAAAGIMTHAMATTGLFLLITYLPILQAAGVAVPWPAILLLVGAPLVSDLLQLSLSRRREFLADAGAVELTGDPVALATALRRIEVLQGDDWERSATRGWRWLHWLRTHPTTRERLEGLAALVAPVQSDGALPFGAWSKPLRDFAPLGGHAWPQRLARRVMP
jgi:heat shock protein HtpX